MTTLKKREEQLRKAIECGDQFIKEIERLREQIEMFREMRKVDDDKMRQLRETCFQMRKKIAKIEKEGAEKRLSSALERIKRAHVPSGRPMGMSQLELDQSRGNKL